VSTVLDAICVASTFRFLVPGGFFAALATRPSTTAPRRLGLPGEGFTLRDVKFEIRNSKFEIAPSFKNASIYQHRYDRAVRIS
jgi:hypothetical protein